MPRFPLVALVLVASSFLSLAAQTTVTTLSASPASGPPGTTVSLVATVRGAVPATALPPGTVTFQDGQQAIGTATLSSANLVAPTLVSGSQIMGSVDTRAACLLAIGDLNADGKMDILSYCGTAFQVFLGDSAGHYSQLPAQTYTASTPFYEPALLDVNGDGNIDIALPGAATLTVLYGSGAGTFASPAAFPSISAQTIGSFKIDNNGNYYSNAISALGSADLNGDGLTDLILGELANSTTTGNLSEVVSVYTNHGGGSFTYMGSAQLEDSTTSSGLTVLPGTVRSFALGDLTSDGKLDVMAAYNYASSSATAGSSQPSANVGVLVNNGTGMLSVASRIPLPCYGLGIGCSPCDMASSSSVGGPNGSTICGPSITTGDFARRGKQDLVLSGEPSSGGNVSVYPGNGDGTFGTAHVFSSASAVSSTGNSRLGGRYASLVATDLDLDGKLDLVDSLGYVYRGDGAFNFANGQNLLGYVYGVVNWNSGIVDQLLMADFSGDGTPDFYFQSAPLDGKPLFLMGSNATAAAVFSSKPSGGTHAMTATYAGSGPFMASTSPAVTVTISKATPTVTGTSSPASVPVTQAITFGVKVTAPNVTPTGIVTFTSGSTTLGTATLDTGGSASVTYTFATVGTQTVTAARVMPTPHRAPSSSLQPRSTHSPLPPPVATLR